MKKNFITSFILLLSITFSFAQSTSRTDTVTATVSKRARNIYVELGGPGLIYSANFDTRFAKTRNGLGGRIGAGYIKTGEESVFTLPVGLNYLLGKGKHFFEMGLGATFASYNSNYTYSYFDPNTNTVIVDDYEDDNIYGINGNGVLGTMTFGYRLQPINSGFTFRGQANTIFGYGQFVPYAGISLGYTF